MHIPDGLLPATVVAGSYAVTGALTWYSLRKINQEKDPQEQVPKAALLTAAFFIGSSIYIPIPPVSVHLVLCGLLGALLGYYAFPSILIGLLLQAILWGHGGITTLGVNALIFGLPALVAHQIFNLRRLRPAKDEKWLGVFGFLAGSLGVVIAVGIFFSLSIIFLPADLVNPEAERALITTLSVFHLPVAVIEGIFTAMLVVYLRRVKPELLRGLSEART